jgi:hypothetical protein
VGKTTTYRTVAGLNKTLRAIPKEASKELRSASLVIANDVAIEARRRASSVGGVAKYVGPSIRGRRDRVPVVLMGGSKRLPPRNGVARTGSNQTVGNVWAGAEWGSHQYTQFGPPTKRGHMLWSTIDDKSDSIMLRWSEALADAIRNTP